MKINVNEVQTQLSSENGQIQEAMTSTYDLTSTINQYTGNTMLQGATYNGFCDMFNNVTKPLIKAVLCMLEAKYDGNTTYARALEQNLAGMGKVDVDALRSSIETSQSKVSDMTSNSVVEFVASPYIAVLEKLITTSQEKLDKIEAFIAQTNGCYEEFDTQNSLVLQGINCARNISFNEGTGNVNGINYFGYDWVDKVNEYYTHKTYEEIREKYGDYCKDNKEDIYKIKQVVEYERFHRGDAEKVNEFLGRLETKDVIGIKAVAYAADPLYRSLWIKYLDRYEIAVVAGDDAYYTSKYDKIVLDPTIYRDEDYLTFFHECGHAVDRYSGDRGPIKELLSIKYTSQTFTSADGQTLDQAIESDVKAYIGVQVATTIASKGYKMSDTQRNEVTENIINNIMSGGETPLSGGEEKIANEIKINFNQNARGITNSLVSDVYGGTTNAELQGSYGHDESYWFNEDGSRRMTPCREYVAEYFAYGMTKHKAGMQSVETYLGGSKEVMDSMLETMGKQ